jgi:hypothetical protein
MKRNKKCSKILCIFLGHKYEKMWPGGNGVANKITICSRCKKRARVLDDPKIKDVYISK